MDFVGTDEKYLEYFLKGDCKYFYFISIITFKIYNKAQKLFATCIYLNWSILISKFLSEKSILLINIMKFKTIKIKLEDIIKLKLEDIIKLKLEDIIKLAISYYIQYILII